MSLLFIPQRVFCSAALKQCITIKSTIKILNWIKSSLYYFGLVCHRLDTATFTFMHLPLMQTYCEFILHVFTESWTLVPNTKLHKHLNLSWLVKSTLFSRQANSTFTFWPLEGQMVTLKQRPVSNHIYEGLRYSLCVI